MFRHSGFGEPARRDQHGVAAEHLDCRGDGLVGAVERRRRHQQLGDIGLQLVVGGAVFRAAESAEEHRAVADGDLLARAGRRARSDGPAACAATPTLRPPVSTCGTSSAARRECACARTASSPGPGRRRRSSRYWRCPVRRSRSPSARDARRRDASTPAGERSRCRAVAGSATPAAARRRCVDAARTSRRRRSLPGPR